MSLNAEKEIDKLIFNENLYLFSHNPEVISRIETLQNVNRICTNEHKEKYKEAFKNYSNFNKIYVSKLIKGIGIPNNSISYSILLSHIMSEGYLSKDMVLVRENEKYKNFKDIFGLLGLDVINGVACCRHFSTLFKDVFKELNICGDLIACLCKENITLKEAFISKHNHVVNMIEYNGIYYAFDPFNNNIYKFIDMFTMEPYFDKRILIYFKPSVNMIYNDETFIEVLNKIIKFDESSKLKPLTLSEMGEIHLETTNLYKNNYNMVEDFIRDTIELKRSIVKSI